MKEKFGFISPKTHGIIDYLAMPVLFLSPVLIGAAYGQKDDSVLWLLPQWIGGLLFGMAFFTDFRWGVFKVIPVSIHLIGDYLIGASLIISALVFKTDNGPFWINIILGIVIIAVALCTKNINQHSVNKTLTEKSGVQPLVPK